ncbi:MAG: helix-turn-helix transcriptional regulator [Proteobacteria bacterium]|nr:helix-turn-helix transcriptional regulator [Pseudomonadota bacterium]
MRQDTGAPNRAGLCVQVNPKRVARSAGEAKRDAEPTEIRRILARNVRLLREEKGLSQRELARLAGLSQKYIWEIEVGAKNVTLDRISELARHLGMTELELLTPRSR